jgi:DNA mismatch endonuclease (patch repair protein)
MPELAPPGSSRRATARAPGRSPNAGPEQALRRRLHALGLRFAHRPRDLPGSPDLVLPGRRSVVFVRECFWHGHGCLVDRAAQRFNSGTWAEKISANRLRDARDQAALRAAGWSVETVWECQIDDGARLERLAERLRQR